MRKDITPYYKALGLVPGAEALEIRRAYRQLIQQWHPDLYKAGSPMQTTAEDITKEINEAYDQLYRKKLYRNFKPSAGRTKNKAPKRKEDTDDDSGQNAENTKASTTPSPRASPRQKPVAPRTKISEKLHIKFGANWVRMAAGIAAALAAVPFCKLLVDPSSLAASAVASMSSDPVTVKTLVSDVPASQVGPGAASRSTKTVTPADTSGSQSVLQLSNDPLQDLRIVQVQFASTTARRKLPSDDTDRARLFARAEKLLNVIELGDTKARVIEIQGTPDDAGETIFRYGSSVVYFRDGLVKGWVDRIPRLHIRAWSETILPPLDTFSLGSTRADVVHAQGLPERFTDSSYSFGSSVVFFDRDIVSGWNEGDVALRRFAMPSLPFIDLERLELWQQPGRLEF